MILRANELGFAYEACLLSAMLSEKDIFKNMSFNCDIYSRFLHLYEKDFDSAYINSHLAKTVLKQAEFFYGKLKNIEAINKKIQKINEEILSILLLLAYPDRLAKQRGKMTLNIN